jgi:hypothetical protein
VIARNARSACSLLAPANRCGTVSRRLVPRRATRSPQDDILSGLLKIQTTPLAKGRSRKAARKRCIQRASDSRIPCPTREALDFHSRVTKQTTHSTFGRTREFCETRLPRGFRAKTISPAAPFLVRGLCTACTRLKTRVVTNAYFRLTEKIEGVQQDRSLTAS